MNYRITYLALTFACISSTNTAVFNFSNGSMQKLYIWPYAKTGKIIAILPPKSLAARIEIPMNLKGGQRQELMVLNEVVAKQLNAINNTSLEGVYNAINQRRYVGDVPENRYLLDYRKGDWTAYTPIKPMIDTLLKTDSERKHGDWKELLSPSFKDARFALQVKKY